MQTEQQKVYSNVASYYFAEVEDFWMIVVQVMRHKEWLQKRILTVN